MKAKRILSTVGAVLAGCLFLVACDSGEQGRPLNYKKGVYLGKPDTPPSQETLKELRSRARYQAGLTTPAGGGGEVYQATREPDVRPPAAAGIDARALRDRAGYQAGTIGGGGGGEASAAHGVPSGVRPPAAAGVDAKALRRRAGRQGYQ